MPLHLDTMLMRASAMPLHPDTMLMLASAMPLHPDTMLMRALTMPLHPDTMLMRAPTMPLHPPALKTLRFYAKSYLDKFMIEKLFHSERTLNGKSFYWLLSLICSISTSAAIIFLYPLPVF